MKSSTQLYRVRHIRDFRDMLDQSATLFANEPAFKLRNKDGSYTTINYTKYREDVRSLGTALWAKGYHGKHIALMGPNSYKWATVYFAVTCGLGVLVPIDKELPFDDVKNILEESESSLLIIDKKSMKKFANQMSQLPEDIEIIVMNEPRPAHGMHSYEEVFEEGRALKESRDQSYLDYLVAPIDPEVMSVLIYTSGTSGMAKGVMLSQKNICFVIMSNSSIANIGPGDQMFAVLPMHHTFECSLGFLAVIYNGCCNAFPTSLLRLTRDMQEVKPTVIFTVPLLVEKMHDKIVETLDESKPGQMLFKYGGKLVNYANDKFGIDLSRKVFSLVLKNLGGRLRLFIIGAAAINPDVVKNFETFGVESYLGYGLTECAPLVSCNYDGHTTLDTVGMPIPGVEVKLDDVNDEGIGELLVRGPNVMLGYYKNEEATREVLDEDGWLHTGDLANVDGNGNIRLTGRKKNVIVTKNGKNIYPEELEDALNGNPFILESMVVGTEREEDDETIVEAKIFPDVNAIKEALQNPDLTAEDVFNYISDIVKEINTKFPNYKKIREVSIRNTEFIKTTTQKVKRYANMDDSATEASGEVPGRETLTQQAEKAIGVAVEAVKETVEKTVEAAGNAYEAMKESLAAAGKDAAEDAAEEAPEEAAEETATAVEDVAEAAVEEAPAEEETGDKEEQQ
ncbi:MAG: AMP-binding protein [Clostridia bacterium]|nr:AMP-binding protein [Clostridia bacterium]